MEASPRGDMRVAGTEVESFASSDLRLMTLGEGPSATANEVGMQGNTKQSFASEQIPTKLDQRG